jgi:hypothetical protein
MAAGAGWRDADVAGAVLGPVRRDRLEAGSAGSGPASAARGQTCGRVTYGRVRAWSPAQPCALIGAMTDACLAEENARLRAKLAETEASLAEAQEAQRRLESIVAELRREKFGRASEKLDPEQFNLPLEGEPMCAIGPSDNGDAAAGRWRRSARTSPSAWTSFLLSSACWSRGARDTPAGAAPGAVVQAHAPEHVVPGGLPTVSSWTVRRDRGPSGAA